MSVYYGVGGQNVTWGCSLLFRNWSS